MKRKDTKHQGLFDNARKVPTELSEARVESIIKNFPTIPPTSIPPTNNWTHFFNLNNLIMMSIPIALVVAMTLSTTSADHLSSNSIDNLSTTITNHETPILNTEIAVLEEKIETINLPNPKVVQKSNNEITNISESVSPIKTEQPIAPPAEIITEQDPIEVIPAKTENDNYSKVEKKPVPSLIPKQLIGGQNLAIPDLNDRQLKKLRKTLYKNLTEDNLIKFKGQFVSIELPSQKIILNKVELPKKFYSKYAELTMIAGTGPNRRIEFTSNFIKVGDFDGEKFRGHGEGTFTDDFPTITTLSEKMESAKTKQELLEEERKALYKFANKVMAKSDITPKGKSFFPANVKYEKLKMIHQELYEQLLLDNLIDSKEAFVFIQIPKYDIAINGKKIQIPLPTKYKNIVDAYKIKYGPRRAILMSSHTISVGDYLEGEFTGTIVYLID